MIVFFIYIHSCLQVDDVVAANPKLIKEVEESIKKGEWSVPGYKEKFGDISYF